MSVSPTDAFPALSGFLVFVKGTKEELCLRVFVFECWVRQREVMVIYSATHLSGEGRESGQASGHC